MKRRGYLASVGAITTGVLSGCSGNTEANTSTTQPELSVGDSAVKDDMFRVTVLETRQLSQMLEDDGDTRTPSPQATFFAVKIKVEHIGETEQGYPETDTIGAIKLFYLDESADSYSSSTFRDSNGREYTSYRSIIFDREFVIGAFPETSVTGWIVYELPNEFEPEEVALKVRQDSGEDLVWRFDES